MTTMATPDGENVETAATIMTKKPIVIGVCGGTASGKTTLADAIYQTLGSDKNVAYLHHDSYYKDITHLTPAERSLTNFDHPDALDTDLLIHHIRELTTEPTEEEEGRRSSSVAVPCYDFTSHARTTEVTVVESKPVILLDGILIFADERLLELMDVKIFVDVESDVRLSRRLSRDVSERGRTPHQIIEQYNSFVRPMHDAFVEPMKKHADVVLNNGRNEVALDMICNHIRVVAGL